MEYLKTQLNETVIEHLGQNIHQRKNLLPRVSINKIETHLVSDTRTFMDQSLETIEQLMLSQVEDYHPDLKAATELVLSSGGKRLRPKLILLIGKLLHANPETLLTLATAIELLHTATLVHDDLIDGSLLRRGVPTLNASWSPAATVLTGDFLFASASHLAAKTNSMEVLRLFSCCLMTIVNGEVNQLFMDRSVINTEEYYNRIYAKTASLFETSTQTAAVISNVDAQQVELMRRFGYELGMAFQIVDDILDYVGSEAVVGKPVGGDLRQGLITLPMLCFIKMYPTDPAVKKIAAGQRIIDDTELQRLLCAISNSDAIHKARLDAEGFIRRAEGCLMSFPNTPEREALIEIARFIVERKK
jgi:geranylgeranyl pyrophosphate synthase